MHQRTHLRFVSAFVLALLVSLGAAGCQPAAPQGIAEGAAAPDFTLRDATGREVSLSDYRGTPVLLFFHMAMG
ncbi:MAG: hypothetical protein Kow0077_14230 [Anaerolineae bacterium]